MPLRRNILSNYASQLYVAVLGIVILPLYIRAMGPEAYGLVSFFAMLQAWFGLLDMGLTPTIAREAARFRGGSMTPRHYRQLFRVLSLIFLGVAMLGGGGIVLAAERIAAQWLNFETLSAATVSGAVQIMGIGVGMRWMAGLYRGVVSGSECFLWLSGFNALMATLRFIGVFGSMHIFGYTPQVFFIHQLVVAAVEFLGLLVKCYALMPRAGALSGPIGWDFSRLRSVLNFSLSIAFTSAVWIAVTQSDRLILSGLLSLADYGYFTLAVMAAGGITLVTAPVSGPIMPRMARLHAEHKDAELLAVYRGATRLIAAVTAAVATTMVVCARPLLLAWTGDAALADHASPILALYAVGNGILAVGAFPYYLQYALGSVRYHLIGNVLIALLLLPAIAYAASRFGGVGAGYAWVGVNVLYLTLWVALVHSRLRPGLHGRWLGTDVLLVALPSVAAGLAVSSFGPTVNSRQGALLYSAAVFAGLAALSTACFVQLKRRRPLAQTAA